VDKNKNEGLAAGMWMS